MFLQSDPKRARLDTASVNPQASLTEHNASLGNLSLDFDHSDEGRRNEALFESHKKLLKEYEMGLFPPPPPPALCC